MKKPQAPSPTQSPKLGQTLSDDDLSLFKNAINNTDGVTRQIKQDKIHLSTQTSKPKHQQKFERQNQIAAEFFFSDVYQANFNDDGPISYVQEGYDSYLAKQLRRGDFIPDITLDLHGLTADSSKRELGEFIHYCHKQHLHCGCIIHGKGQYILKKKVPHYLVQHPKVIAFHQAPKNYGGQSALLVLIDVPER